MGNNNADEATAHHEEHAHQQNQSIIPVESKTNMNGQQLSCRIRRDSEIPFPTFC